MNNIAKEKQLLRKEWHKPLMLTICQKKLAEYIMVSARSGGGGCMGRSR